MTTTDRSSLWPLRVLQALALTTSILLFAQAVLAGLFMSEVRIAFDLHRENATVTGVVLMITIVAAVIARARSQAPRWMIAAPVVLLLLMSLQAFAGFRKLTAMHIPLSVVVIGAAVTLTVAVWRWKVPGPTE